MRTLWLAGWLVVAACEHDTPGHAGQDRGRVGSVRYVTVDELLADDLTQWRGRSLKVHGWVVPGSVREHVIDGELTRTFVVHKASASLRVFGKGPKPDTFKDQAEVIVTGRLVSATERSDLAAALHVGLEGGYVLDADELQAKCPDNYVVPGTAGRSKFE